MRDDLCLQCGRRIDHRREAYACVVGGNMHVRCVPPPAGRIATTALPPPELDIRRQRAGRVEAARYVTGGPVRRAP